MPSAFVGEESKVHLPTHCRVHGTTGPKHPVTLRRLQPPKDPMHLRGAGIQPRTPEP